MEYDFHKAKMHDLHYTPKNLTGNAKGRAYQADKDARALIADVRQLEPAQIWGRINRWAHENPQRVIAAMVSLAAMADLEAAEADTPPPWTVPIDGTAALHPDFGVVRTKHPNEDGIRAERHREVVRLLKTELTYTTIAVRVGVGLTTVQRLAVEHGLTREKFDPTERDAQIMQLLAQGKNKVQVAAAAGCSTRTVDRAIERDQKRREAAA